ncbi:MAG: DUF4840 domain-containing protein [Prevotella sp.]|nr:DUF4840 domain-containing protein [Prevotella sp.]
MKKMMKAAFTALGAFVMVLFFTGCSTDTDNNEQHTKTMEQVLNNMVGTYKGSFGFNYGSTSVNNWTTSWTINKQHVITIEKFPYPTLANGIRKRSGDLYDALQNLEEKPLTIVITNVGLSDKSAALSIAPQIKFTVTTPVGTYELEGQMSNNLPVMSNYYTISTSAMELAFKVEKLVKVDNAHGTSEVQSDFDTPITYNLRSTQKD